MIVAFRAAPEIRRRRERLNKFQVGPLEEVVGQVSCLKQAAARLLDLKVHVPPAGELLPVQRHVRDDAYSMNADTHTKYTYPYSV